MQPVAGSADHRQFRWRAPGPPGDARPPQGAGARAWPAGLRAYLRTPSARTVLAANGADTAHLAEGEARITRGTRHRTRAREPLQSRLRQQVAAGLHRARAARRSGHELA